MCDQQRPEGLQRWHLNADTVRDAKSVPSLTSVLAQTSVVQQSMLAAEPILFRARLDGF